LKVMAQLVTAIHDNSDGSDTFLITVTRLCPHSFKLHNLQECS
jgi:Mg2+/citrate symporter